MEFFEDASKSPGVLRSIRLNSVLVVVIVTGVSGAISLFVLAVGLLIFKRFRSRVNHIGESDLVKYPIGLTEIAYSSSPLDELDGKSHHPTMANGQAVQPRCACRLSGNHRPESCDANQEQGRKIFSLEIPTANLSEFATWGDKMDTSHATTSPTSRCHGRDDSPLCIECLANERKPLGLSPLDLAPISAKQ